MRTSHASVGIADLGPGNESMFCLMSGHQIGNVLYIGSRNLHPTMVLGYDLAKRKIISRYDLGGGKFVQALTSSRDGHTLYAGVVGAADDEANVYAISLTDDSPSSVPFACIPGLGVRDLTVAPDGEVYAVGHEQLPGLWACHPRDGTAIKIAVPDPGASEIRAVLATDSTVFVGSGSELAGGDGASRSAVFALDRASGELQRIPLRGMEQDPAIRSLAIADGKLLVGSTGVRLHSHLAVISLEDYSMLHLSEATGKAVGLFYPVANKVFFAAGKIFAYDLHNGTVGQVSDHAGAERWALGYFDGELIVLSAAGSVIHIELESGSITEVDLIAAGAPVMPQLGMTIAVAGNQLVLSGNGAIVRHALDGSAPPEKLTIPGEAKSMQRLGDGLFLAQYNSEGIWNCLPNSLPQRVAELPVEQNRPQDTAWDEANSLLLVGSENDVDGGGSLAIYNPGNGEVSVHINPLDSRLAIRAVAVEQGVCIIGGWNKYASGPRGQVARFDHLTGQTLWSVDPDLDGGVSALAITGDVVLGMTITGTLFKLSLASGELLKSRNVQELVPGFSRTLLDHGRTYVSTDTSVFSVDTELNIEVLADDLAGEWYSGPSIAADHLGNLYTLRGRNIIRLKLAPEPSPDKEKEEVSVNG